LLEVRGLIKPFSMAECVGILCLIIKFAIMAYYSGIKISSLPDKVKTSI
jgi:hypothetical protein